MKKGAFRLIFTAIVAILSLVVCLPKNSTYGAEILNTKVNHYLLSDDNQTPYLSTVDAGTSTGYNEYLLGEINIEPIEATASKGFQIVGWRLLFTEDVASSVSVTRWVDDKQILNNSQLFKTDTFSITYQAENNAPFSVDYTISYSDTDNDGYNETSILRISKIVENVTIDPVFDYIYTNVNVTEAIELTGIVNDYAYTSVDTDGSVMYYKTETTLSDKIQYNDSYLHKNGSYFYFGEVFKDNGSDIYYTLNDKMEGETPTKTDKVPIQKGRYRLGEEVDLSFNVNIEDDDIRNSVNIDLIGASISVDNKTTKLSQDKTPGFNYTRDRLNRTSQINLNFTAENSVSKEIIVNLNYDKLHIVSIKTTINEVDVTTENEAYLLGALTITPNSYHAENEAKKQYLVKTNTASALGFELTANKEVSNQGYKYYTFNKISTNNSVVSACITGNKFKLTKQTDEDFELIVDYTPVKYKIEFKFGVYNETNKTIEPLAGKYNINDTIYLERGQESEEIIKTAGENVGYTFFGFVLNDNVTNLIINEGVDALPIIKVNIDKLAPADKIVYMLFKENEYTLHLNNINQLNLQKPQQDGTTQTIYTIKEIVLSLTRDGKISKQSILPSSANETINFATSFKLNDEIRITVYTNDGFKLEGFGFTASDKTSTGNVFNLSLTSEFLKSFDENGINQIDAYDFESLLTYNLTYIINAVTLDSGETVIMADISMEYNGATYDKDNFGGNFLYEANDSFITITATNLHLYDKVKLISKPRKSISQEGEPFTYLFNRFTENSQTNFELDADASAESPAFTYMIEKDKATITVEYSVPGLWLNLSIDNENAYNLSQTKIYLQSDSEKTPINISKEQLSPNTDYVLELVGNLNFGFELMGYNYNGTVRQNNSKSFAFHTEGASLHTIQILTKETRYKFNLTYNTTDGEIQTIGSYEIKISNLNLNFSIITGYYISNAYFVDAHNTKHVYNSLIMGNENQNTQISHTFTTEQLSGLVNECGKKADDGVINLNLHLVYTRHTYTFTVNYGLVNNESRKFNYVSFPEITIEAKLDGVSVAIPFESHADKCVFKNIPYGATTKISANAVQEEGLSAHGWNYKGYSNPTTTLTDLTINSIKENETATYLLNIIYYDIRILTEGYPGTPIVSVANKENATQISFLDSLQIKMNADKSKGFMFDKMTYSKYVYKVYSYDETSFANETAKIYVLKNNKHVLNTEPFDANETYYKHELVLETYSAFTPYTYNENNWENDWKILYYFVGDQIIRNTSSVYDPTIDFYKYEKLTYEDSSFKIGNYYAQTDDNGRYSIVFTISYKSIKIGINVNASTVSNMLLNDTIPADEFADIGFSKIIDNNETLLSNTPIITIEDNILRVKVQLKTIPINGVNCNIWDGVVLASAYIYSEGAGKLTINNKGNGLYELQFYIAEMLGKNCLSDNDIFNIYLIYKIEDKHIEITTNVDANEFYKNGKDVLFSMVLAMDGRTMQSSGSPSLSNVNKPNPPIIKYLTNSTISYEFKSGRGEYFRVSGVKIYKFNLTKDQYGATVYTKGDAILNLTNETLATYGISGMSLENRTFNYLFVGDIYIELQVQPIITVNSTDNEFRATFDCDNDGNGKEQILTVGQSNTNQIQIADLLVNYLELNYHKNILGVGYETNPSIPKDAGKYSVKLSFSKQIADKSWAWLSKLEITNQILFIIEPKEIDIRVDTNKFASKEPYQQDYAGKGEKGYTFKTPTELLKYVYFTDNARSFSYSQDNENFSINLANLKAYITYTNGDVQVETGRANENEELYNLYLQNIALNNPNFVLKQSSLLFERAMRIYKAEITLNGIKVYDKVYDGTDYAEFNVDSVLSWIGVFAGDDVSAPNYLDLKLAFAKDTDGKVNVGKNKNILINADEVLKGDDAGNYKIKVNGTTANVYPYSVTAQVEGFGEIELRNDKGLINLKDGTRHELVNLIPIGAKLKIDVVRSGTGRFVDMYPNISKFLGKNEDFVVGYVLHLVNDTVETEINNNLTLLLPNVERLRKVLLVTSNDSFELTKSVVDGRIMVDLSQTNFAINSFAITQQRVLFKLWQLILIISLSLAVIATVVVIFIIVRKRKKERYSLNEKI